MIRTLGEFLLAESFFPIYALKWSATYTRVELLSLQQIVDPKLYWIGPVDPNLWTRTQPGKNRTRMNDLWQKSHHDTAVNIRSVSADRSFCRWYHLLPTHAHVEISSNGSWKETATLRTSRLEFSGYATDRSWWMFGKNGIHKISRYFQHPLPRSRKFHIALR